MNLENGDATMLDESSAATHKGIRKFIYLSFNLKNIKIV